MSDKRCDLCGSFVKVVGKTTMHYELDIEKILPSEDDFNEWYCDDHYDANGESISCPDALSAYRWLRKYVKEKLR